MSMKMPEEITTIPVDMIDPAVFQPSSRVTESALKSLKKSIQSDVGLVYPLVVVEQPDRYALVDGHRRCAVLIDLGMESVPCIVMDYDQAIAFAEVNGHHRLMRGVDQQEIYFKDPRALTDSQRRKLASAVYYFGESFSKEIAETRAASLTSLRAECGKVERLLRRYTPEFFGEHYGTADLGRAVIEKGSRKVANIIRDGDLTDPGKANRLAELLG